MVMANQLVSEVVIKDSASANADRVTAAMNNMADAEERVQSGADGVSTKVTGSTRALETSARSFESLKRAADPAYARMVTLADQHAKLQRAVSLGTATQTEANAVYAVLKTRAEEGAGGIHNLAESHTRLSAQGMEAFHVMRSMTEQLAIGAPITQVMAQHISQLSYAASGPGGLKAAFGEATAVLGRFITPATVAITVAVALGAAFVGLAEHAANGQGQLRAYTVLLEGMGAAGLATAAQLKEMQTQLRDSGMSTADAQAAIQGVVREGFNPVSAGRVVNTGRDIGAILGGDGTKTLTDALKGGISSTIELGLRLHALTAEEAESYRAMSLAGQGVAALDQAFAKISDAASGKYEQSLGASAKALQQLKTAWDEFLDALTNNGLFQRWLNGATLLLQDASYLLGGRDTPGGVRPGQDGYGATATIRDAGLSKDAILDLIAEYESDNRNIRQNVYSGSGINPSTGTHTAPSTASGYFQITDQTWRGIAAAAGIDASQYPTAMSAPYALQRQAAGALYDRRGVADWAPYNPALAAALQGSGATGAASLTRPDDQQKIDLINQEIDARKRQAQTYGLVGESLDVLVASQKAEEFNRDHQVSGAAAEVNRLNAEADARAKVNAEAQKAIELGRREVDQAGRTAVAGGPDALALTQANYQAATEAFNRYGNAGTEANAYALARRNQIAQTRAYQIQQSGNQLGQNLDFDRQQLGRNADDQAVFSQLRSANQLDDSGKMRNAQAEMLANQIKFNQTLAETKSLASDFATGFVHDLMAGRSATEALSSAFQRLAQRLADKAIDNLLSSLFGATTSGAGGGIFGGLFGFLGIGGGSGASAIVPGTLPEVLHSGGIAGSGLNVTRMVDPEIFRNAPRFAAGLNAYAPGINEVPVLAHKGELIGWPDQMAKTFGGGQTIHFAPVTTVNVGAGNNVTMAEIRKELDARDRAFAAAINPKAISASLSRYGRQTG